MTYAIDTFWIVKRNVSDVGRQQNVRVADLRTSSSSSCHILTFGVTVEVYYWSDLGGSLHTLLAFCQQHILLTGFDVGIKPKLGLIAATFQVPDFRIESSVSVMRFGVRYAILAFCVWWHLEAWIDSIPSQADIDYWHGQAKPNTYILVDWIIVTRQ